MDLHKPPQDKENTYNMIIHKFKFFNLPFLQAATTRHHHDIVVDFHNRIYLLTYSYFYCDS